MNEITHSQENAQHSRPTQIPTRLELPAVVQEEFGISVSQWKTLCESLFPSAKSVDSVVLAMSYCRSRNLDVMKKPVHIVPVWNSQVGRMVETVWPSLNLYRTEAARTGHYAGIDTAEFGDTVTVPLTGTVGKSNQPVTKEFSYPEWCQVTVYRMVKGQRCPFRSPRVYWREYYATNKRGSDLPNEQWARRPSYMLEKVAESLALRRAFPEECSDPTADEMEAAANPHVIEPDSSALDRLKEAREADQTDAQAQQADNPDDAPEYTQGDIEDAEIIPDDEDDWRAEVEAERQKARELEEQKAREQSAPQDTPADNAGDPDPRTNFNPLSKDCIAGAEAFQKGENIGSCPHDDLETGAARDWISGFKAAQRAAA
jgi:phage recombination protein Bet